MTFQLPTHEHQILVVCILIGVPLLLWLMNWMKNVAEENARDALLTENIKQIEQITQEIKTLTEWLIVNGTKKKE